MSDDQTNTFGLSGRGSRGRRVLSDFLIFNTVEQQDSTANGPSLDQGSSEFGSMGSGTRARGRGTGANRIAVSSSENFGSSTGDQGTTFGSRNRGERSGFGSHSRRDFGGSRRTSEFGNAESSTGDRSRGFNSRSRGDRTRGDRSGRGFRGESRGGRGGRGQFQSNFGSKPHQFDSANALDDFGQPIRENASAEGRRHDRNNFSDRAETNRDGEPINRNYIPDYRNADAIFQEDEEHKQEYANIADDDEDITVTPFTDQITKLDSWKDEGIIHEKLLENIYRAGYVRPRKIQAYSIPFVCRGMDVIGHAETGSGKTLGYLVPVVDFAWKKRDGITDIPAERYPEPYAIIILPTRELAMQIRDQAVKLAAGSSLKVHVSYGQIGFKKVINNLLTGCDILVSTPGILHTFVRNSDIGFRNLKFFVLDEADRLLTNEGREEMGFVKVITEIFKTPTFPPKEDRINLMFSATYTQDVQNLAKQLVMRPDMVLVSNNKFQGSNHRIRQSVIQVVHAEKFSKLVELMKEERANAEKNNPSNPKVRPIIIFVDAKRRTKQLSLYFTSEKIPSTFINGDMSQESREVALKEFREQKVSLLIATDVLARGIDFKDLDYVINCDLTDEIATYIHRIGRTGRLRQGMATTFFDPDNPRNVAFAGQLIKLIEENGDTPPPFLVDAARNRPVSQSTQEQAGPSVQPLSMNLLDSENNEWGNETETVKQSDVPSIIASNTNAPVLDNDEWGDNSEDKLEAVNPNSTLSTRTSTNTLVLDSDQHMQVKTEAVGPNGVPLIQTPTAKLVDWDIDDSDVLLGEPTLVQGSETTLKGNSYTNQMSIDEMLGLVGSKSSVLINAEPKNIEAENASESTTKDYLDIGLDNI